MVPEYLERLLANSEVVPATNQIESHPYVTFIYFTVHIFILPL